MIVNEALLGGILMRINTMITTRRTCFMSAPKASRLDLVIAAEYCMERKRPSATTLINFVA